jgi:hypothetical protein
MLIVRDAQLAIFRQASIQRFIGNLLAFLAAEYPGHLARFKPAEARAFVEASIVAAQQFRIQTQGSVGAFIELRLIYGENLERAPDRQWARNILAHPTLPDYIKVGAVQDRLSERAGGRVLVVHEEPA